MSWWTALNVRIGVPRRRAGKLTAAEVEQLLTGGSVAADRNALAALLARAAAPGDAEDPAGLEEAIDAFARAGRESPHTPSPARSRPSRARSGSADRTDKIGPLKLTVSVAAIVIVAVGLVAATGQLPAQRSVDDFLASVGLAVPAASHASVGPMGSPSKSGQAKAHETPSTTTAPAASPTDTTSPLVPLCRTYLSEKKPGKGMAAADLDRLTQAAGTTDGIDAFCTQLLARQSPIPTPTPTAVTSPDAVPGTSPASKPTCHGNGKKACPTPNG